MSIEVISDLFMSHEKVVLRVCQQDILQYGIQKQHFLWK